MNWKIAQSIYNKITNKCPIGKLNNASERPDINKFSMKYYVARSHVSVGINPGGCTHYRIVSQNYTTTCQNQVTSGAKFLNFNTEQERYNAWQSYLTKFARFCVMLDESTKLAPYMDDYSEPWTDKRFKEYFELTDIEWQLIDKVISGKIK